MGLVLAVAAGIALLAAVVWETLTEKGGGGEEEEDDGGAL